MTASTFRESLVMNTDKPLSPHLQIYRLPLTAILSILHRMTGALLGMGLLVMVSWLAALAADAEVYQWMYECFGTLPGQMLLVAWTAALYLHLCNGIRHLIWDMGLGFELSAVDKSAGLTILGTIVLTAATWAVFLMMRGGV